MQWPILTLLYVALWKTPLVLKELKSNDKNLPSKSLHLSLELGGGASTYLPPLCVTTDMLLRDSFGLLVLSARPFSSVGVGPRLLSL